MKTLTLRFKPTLKVSLNFIEAHNNQETSDEIDYGVALEYLCNNMIDSNSSKPSENIRKLENEIPKKKNNNKNSQN